MFTYYYEINENYKQYPPVIKQNRGSLLSVPAIICYISNRVWREDHNTGEITFAKNRYFPPNGYTLTHDDIKEFRWIKLKAVEV